MSGITGRNKRGLRYLASTAGAAGLAACILIGLPGLAGAAGSFPSYRNTFNSKTTGWCTAAQGCNGQVGAGDYGTIDIVPHTFSNEGGYAAAVPSPGTQKHYARVSGAGSDQDSLAGCPAPGSENCTGPYILFGGTGKERTPIQRKGDGIAQRIPARSALCEKGRLQRLVINMDEGIEVRSGIPCGFVVEHGALLEMPELLLVAGGASIGLCAHPP